jgi:MFS family permease
MAAIGATAWSIAQMLSGTATGYHAALPRRARLGPYTERGIAVGCTQAGTLLGPALSAPLVAWLIAATSWPISFFVTGAVGLIWVVVWAALVSTPENTRWIPEPERQRILAERHAGEVMPTAGVGYRGLLRSPSMWGLAISQGTAVYSVYLYLSWLPDYLQTARGPFIVKSDLFTSIPFLIGAAVMVLTNWIGDRISTHQTMHQGARRIVVAACLLLRDRHGDPIRGLAHPRDHPDHLPCEFLQYSHRDQRGPAQRFVALTSR